MSLISGLGRAAWALPFLFGMAAQGAGQRLRSNLTEPSSTFFSTSFVEFASTLNTASDGDLWPATWADDGNVYTANGDGRGFSDLPMADAVVNRIAGTPETGLTGERLAFGDALGPVWADTATYNRKPTGIVAVDGDGDGHDELYLVVQALNKDTQSGRAFGDAPAASVLRSTDYGATWTATEAPMFRDSIFTTVWFLDFGQSNAHASVLGDDGANYVYAYGLDNNWRDSASTDITDPQDLWLARAPVSAIQNISQWEFFSGTAEAPAWTADIKQRRAVLRDERRVYPGPPPEHRADGFSVLSQGHVVYDAPLRRYLYASWTDYTFELYEAPQPWGPWSLFESKDFGSPPWFGSNTSTPKNGGYGTTIPSKWISADGHDMWLQANWFVGVVPDSDFNYCYSLRRMSLSPFAPSKPSNEADNSTNLASAPGAVAISKTAHRGKIGVLNDGNHDGSEDSWDASEKPLDRWGYTWPKQYRLDRVVYTTGDAFDDGGWFAANLTVQVRRDFHWVDVAKLAVTPTYPYDKSALPRKTYTFTFDAVAGDGVQIIGAPGGEQSFTSISELEVYYDG